MGGEPEADVGLECMVETVNISPALAVEGWMTAAELAWLAEQAVDHHKIVEIGSYLGRSTLALLDNCDGIVYACDDWKGPRESFIEHRNQLFTNFCLNVGHHILSGKVRIVSGDHADIQFNGKADMVFIDGSHEYEDVKRDILFWKDKLEAGGLLCGHDADWDTVAQAVEETLGAVKVAEDTNIWFKIWQP